MDERELLRRCRAGEPEAYHILFERYHRPAWRLAYAITGDPALADDATQEAFIQAFRSIRNIRDGSPFGPWFYAVVANQARRTVRRRWWRRVLPLVDAQTAPDVRADAELSRAEHRNDVWEAVRALPVDLRLLVALRYVMDWKEEDVAATLGLPVGTVKSRLHRARRLLQQRLGCSRRADESWTP